MLVGLRIHLTKGGSAGRADGVVHIGVGFFAGGAVALVAMLEVLKISLQNDLASLAKASGASFGESVLGSLRRIIAGLRAELLNGVERAPVKFVLPLAFASHRLVQGIDQEVVQTQDEKQPDDPEGQKPLVHGAKRIASGYSVPADSRAQHYYWVFVGSREKHVD